MVKHNVETKDQMEDLSHIFLKAFLKMYRIPQNIFLISTKHHGHMKLLSFL